MQFKIENKVTTTQTVTVDAPACYKALDCHYFLTDKNLMKVNPYGVISVANSTYIYTLSVQDIVKYGEKITKQEFELEFNKKFKCLAEQYQSLIAMNIGYIDPKEGQEEETKDKAPEETVKEEGEAKEGAGALVD